MPVKVRGERVGRAFFAGLLAAFLLSCGNGADPGQSPLPGLTYTGKTTPCEISEESIGEILLGINGTVPICTVSYQPGGSQGESSLPAPLEKAPRISERLFDLASRQESVILGDCGGSISYRDLRYQEGGFHGTVFLDNLCAGIAGEREYLNGSILFENTVPLTQALLGFRSDLFQADAPLITLLRKTAEGFVTGTARYNFQGLVFAPVSSERLATDTTAGTYKVAQVTIDTQGGLGKRSVRVDGIRIFRKKQGDGTTKEMISARIYLDTLGYLDAATDPLDPIVVEPDGTHRCGSILLAGANGSRARLTIVPAFNPTFSVEVNGVPLAGTTLSCLKIPLSQRVAR